MALVTGTAARAQRVASGCHASKGFRATLTAAARSCAVQRLFFGDFLLARQKKVTRPPGRTPGTVHRVQRLPAKATEQPAYRVERLYAKESLEGGSP